MAPKDVLDPEESSELLKELKKRYNFSPQKSFEYL